MKRKNYEARETENAHLRITVRWARARDTGSLGSNRDYTRRVSISPSQQSRRRASRQRRSKEVPKPDGSNRFIFNLKELNKFIDPPHFKLEDIRSILGLVSLGDFLGTMDQDAYLKFAEFLGVLTSACPAVTYGFIHCKQLERQKYLALTFNGSNYEDGIVINESMVEDLNWWRVNATIRSNLIKTNKYVMEIFSDSSLTGWGCYCDGVEAFGFRDQNERKKHINYLKLLAAFLAIKCFASKSSNCEILLRLDNTSAISYINRAGGVRFRHLCALSKEIWNWCEERRLWLKASYVASADNTEADRASRNVNIDSEWELAQAAFSEIVRKFGSISVDLFASRLNKKSKRFYSRFPDPGASAVDAFTVSWKNENFYAFHPFALITRTLRKIINEKAVGIVVVPLWLTQPWYPLFTSSLIEPTITFKPDINLLKSLYRYESHPLASHLSLVAGKLSGQHI
ncbi:PREDICTED: uncharacterized protein LOC107071471 [Polistes dominula]|uniref:Uncharacterized protein LOC107071471 n=1 Tax=Polistes dominula TaxID=743375 RepID=A0ABM1J0K1_POLDO|nr:PREDICTED: uncharacterized protein LOC107071471 [Polistes dominula]